LVGKGVYGCGTDEPKPYVKNDEVPGNTHRGPPGSLSHLLPPQKGKKGPEIKQDDEVQDKGEENNRPVDGNLKGKENTIDEGPGNVRIKDRNKGLTYGTHTERNDEVINKNPDSKVLGVFHSLTPSITEDGHHDTLGPMISISERLDSLRQAMKQEGLAAYLVDEVDPHQSEYPPAYWRRRSWISGFTGSAGTVVVTDKKAGLWTDSRYFLEAEETLKGTGIELFREGISTTPSIEEWLVHELPAGSVLGLPEEVTSIKRLSSLADKLRSHDISVTALEDIVLPLWDDRPRATPSEIWEISPDITGETRTERLARLSRWLSDRGLDGLAIASLDDIAWLLNVRGWDVPYNPVVVAFLLVERQKVRLFADLQAEQPREGVRRALGDAGVETHSYDSFYSALAELPKDYKLAGDPELLPARLSSRFSGTLRRESQPTRRWKAVKTPEEIEGMAEGAIRDGVALAKLFHWLEVSLDEGKHLTEQDCRDALVDFKAQDPDYLAESFEAISAGGSHGAIIHYRVSPGSNASLIPGDLYLLDQGSHYRFATTDATRVEALVHPEAAQQEDYTEVLRAHIALATVRFPRGTRGGQLDTIARDVLWRSSRNYGHGTGHGVGFLLNVHEGPCRIAPKCGDVPLEPGMVLSNEPGLYRPGRYGIRFENLVTVVEEESSGRKDDDFGPFMAFRTLGMAPLDPRLVDVHRLSPAEQAWIREYQSRVLNLIGPRLDSQARSWLEARSKLLPG
jgi:Xaa-Pro aminopeptidase